MIGAPAPAHTGISRRTASILVLVVLGIVIVALLNLVHVPYAIYRPGPVHNTLGTAPDGSPMITIKGADTYETSGALDFTTVSLYGGPAFPVTAWDWVAAHFEDDATILPEAQVFPDEVSAEQLKERNTAQMVHSQEEAAVVALRALGESVPEHVDVVEVVEDAPAKGVLKADDEILSVAGQDVTDAASVSDLLQEHEPGDVVPVTVRRKGEKVELEVPTGESQGRVVVGVLLRSRFDLPLEIEIDAGNVGGPSAGMMFGLGVYDKLTPGQLTGGKTFAGTGTLDSQGNVGPIGGIRQKMAGAEDAGADYFLAPEANCDEVVGHVPDGLEVAKVATFDEALALVKKIGADKDVTLPRC